MLICEFSNKKLLFLSLFSLSISGCGGIYGYQPPASVYGEKEGTDPYAERIILPAQSSVERIEGHTTQSQVSQQAADLQSAGSSINHDTQVVKKTLSPAVVALMSEADRNSKAGQLDSAVATIERALRIDTRNPILTYKLAVLRLKQSKPRLAEDLAKKAALLAGNDKNLKKQSWLLISEARRQQNNLYGAKEAKLKANSF
ncbi:MAG: hypothetical protein KAQ91_03080 [Methylococcales bacterium]|nr:hypothetical protein [Methylococcales bacterium]